MPDPVRFQRSEAQHPRADGEHDRLDRVAELAAGRGDRGQLARVQRIGVSDRAHAQALRPRPGGAQPSTDRPRRAIQLPGDPGDAPRRRRPARAPRRSPPRSRAAAGTDHDGHSTCVASHPAHHARRGLTDRTPSRSRTSRERANPHRDSRPEQSGHTSLPAARSASNRPSLTATESIKNRPSTHVAPEPPRPSRGREGATRVGTPTTPTAATTTRFRTASGRIPHGERRAPPVSCPNSTALTTGDDRPQHPVDRLVERFDDGVVVVRSGAVDLAPPAGSPRGCPVFGVGGRAGANCKVWVEGCVGLVVRLHCRGAVRRSGS
jgi:hypothetical protein